MEKKSLYHTEGAVAHYKYPKALLQELLKTDRASLKCMVDSIVV